MRVGHLVWLVPRHCPHIQEPHQDHSRLVVIKVERPHMMCPNPEGEEEVDILCLGGKAMNFGVGLLDIFVINEFLGNPISSLGIGIANKGPVVSGEVLLTDIGHSK